MHYIYSEKTWAGSTPPEGMGAGEFFPGRVAGAAAGDRSRLHRLKTDSGLHDLTLSGAETARHDTGGDTKLT